MTRQITQLSAHQNGKLAARLYGIFGIIFIIVSAIASLLQRYNGDFPEHARLAPD